MTQPQEPPPFSSFSTPSAENAINEEKLRCGEICGVLRQDVSCSGALPIWTHVHVCVWRVRAALSYCEYWLCSPRRQTDVTPGLLCTGDSRRRREAEGVSVTTSGNTLRPHGLMRLTSSPLCSCTYWRRFNKHEDVELTFQQVCLLRRCIIRQQCLTLLLATVSDMSPPAFRPLRLVLGATPSLNRGSREMFYNACNWSVSFMERSCHKTQKYAV